MRPPRKIRQLPEAQEASDGDMFPVSQMIGGQPRTRAMSRGRFIAEIVEAVADARQGLVDEFAARDAALEDMVQAVQAALAENDEMDAQMQATLEALQEPIQWDNIMGRPSTFAPASHSHAWADITGKPSTFPAATHTHAGLATLVGTATITETALLALTAGVRRVNVPIAGVVPAGNYIALPASVPPAGYGIMDAICTANNTLQVSLIAPLLAIGASYSIPIRVVRINT